MYFASPGGFRRCCQSRCFTLVTSLELASDNNSSTSSWRWKIGREKMPEKTRRFFSPEKKLLLSLWSSSASRRVFTWNWKFEIQDVNLFGRFTGNRWWITCWFGLMWFPSIFVRFNTIPSIFVNHRARWNHVRTINPPHQRVLRIHFNLLNFSSKFFSVHRTLPWTSAGDLPQTGQHWKPEKKHARNDLRVSYWCFIHTPSKWLWSWTQILIDWKLRTEQKQFNLSLSTMVNFVGKILNIARGTTDPWVDTITGGTL